MRKLIAIAFLSLYVFSSTECSELLKLPALVDHFYQHQEENKSITLWSFLCMHYAHGDVNDADRDQDMKLPYKSVDCNNNFVFIIILPENNFDLSKIILPIENKANNDFYLNRFYSSNCVSIWQPPKIA